MKKILLILCVSVFAVSCNDDFTVTADPGAAVVPLTVTATQTGACSFDFQVKSGEGVAKIFYVIIPATDSIPVSSEIFRGAYADSDEELPVKSLNVASNATITVSESGLTPGISYTLYGVTVNKDGIRTEEVFTQNVTVPAYTATNLNDDFTNSTFTGTPTITGVGTTYPNFTPTVTKVADNQYTFNTFWGPTFIASALNNPQYANVVALSYSGTLTINQAADGTYNVTIVGNNSAAWDNGGGTGTYDPCTKTLSYTLTQGLFRLDANNVPKQGSVGTVAPVKVTMTLN